MALAESHIAAYGFERDFEAAIVVAEVSSPRFHDLIGHALNPEQMPTSAAKLLIMAAHAVALRTGAGCPSSVLAIQHLRTLCDGGKLTFDELVECSDYLDLAEDVRPDMPVNDLVEAAIPILKRVKHKEVVQRAVRDFGKGAELDDVADEINKVVSLGRKRASLGQGLVASEADVLSVVSTSLVDPLPTGIFELDSFLHGGLEKHALGVVVADTGTGKSFFLCSLAVEALLLGYNVAFVSLELSEAQVKKRVYSNLTNMTTEDLKEDPKTAVARLKAWQAEGIGELRVLKETPRMTTPAHVRRWLRDLEREQNFKARVLVVDYADKMISQMGTKRSSYEDLGIVYEEIRTIAEEIDGWTWTASQAKGQAHNKKKIGTNMAADSQNKMRVCDLEIGMGRTVEDEENDQVRFNIGKRREGEDSHEVGPLQRDCARGRIVLVTDRPEPW